MGASKEELMEEVDYLVSETIDHLLEVYGVLWVQGSRQQSHLIRHTHARTGKIVDEMRRVKK